MKYLQIQFKKLFRLLPVLLFVNVLLIVSLGMTALLIGRAFESKKGDTSKVRVGIVGDMESSYINFGINMLNTMDTSGAFVRFESLSEDDARKKLQSGDIIGYFDISSDFIEGLSKGENRPIRFVSSQTSGALMYALGKEVASTLTDLLVHSELAVYAMENYYIDHPDLGDVYRANEDLNKKLIFGVFERKNIYDVQTVNSLEEINVVDYYLGGMIMFYLLMSGLGMSVMFASKDNDLLKLLCARNTNSVVQILCEYITMVFMNFLGIAVILAMVLFAKHVFLQEWAWADYRMSSFFWSISGVVLMSSAIQLFLFEWIRDIVPVMMVQFVFGLALSFLSGILYPLSFFPKSMQDIAMYLPARQGMLLLYQGMGYPVRQSLLYMIAMTLLSFVLALCLRFRRVTR